MGSMIREPERQAGPAPRGPHERTPPVVISGGQTGVDRGALDAALAAGVPCGGFAPAARRAEDGRIPSRYPVTPLPGAGYRARTRANVRAANATVILHHGVPAGGTRETLRACRLHGRPCLVLDAGRLTPAQAGRAMARFVRRHRVLRLNVAGPRESEWPGAAAYARAAVAAMLYRLGRPIPSG